MALIRILSTAIVLAIALQCYAITEEETKNFGTTGMPERNTGLVGWVTVTEHMDGTKWIFRSNGIPDHDTATWPWPGVNPNFIREQSYQYTLPKTPRFATEATCLPGGPIGMASNGLPLYNPWNAFSENAVAGDTAEIFDLCDGHPDEPGRYHYHKQPASCLFKDPSQMLGVAFDGFAIYGPVDENGKTLTSADLDECHGRYNNGGTYQYHATADFPYILGCFKGKPHGIVIHPDFCYFASDADENGNIPKASASNHEMKIAGAIADIEEDHRPRVPANLWQRRLPKNYIEFLSKKLFEGVA
ncbi:uncharacterized protein [Amphiura filiformis]|uniref:uncharacterized protein n=1 Tax=Amphiura filiformis TaxID=82378 RepID=UPI003B2158BB